MDTVKILRDLWRLRIFVAGVCLVALLAGVAVAFKVPTLKSRSYEVGVATTRILIDTPNSQVVTVAPKGSDTTATRADLLASLMVDGVIKSAIAQRAGLQPNEVSSTTQAATDASAGAAAGATATASAVSGPQNFVLTTQVLYNNTGVELPIIEVDTQAPTRAQAAKLANATIAGLSDYLNSKAAGERVPDADRLQVSALGVPQVGSVARGPSNLIAILVVVVVFLLGCGGILGVSALARGWRAASVREKLRQDGHAVSDWELAPDELFVDDVVTDLAPDRRTTDPSPGTNDPGLVGPSRASAGRSQMTLAPLRPDADQQVARFTGELDEGGRPLAIPD